MSARRLFLCFAASALLSAADAGDKIWSAVLLATNASNPKPAPAELKPIAARLQRVFGYNQFEIVGRDTAAIDDDAKFSLTPTKTFWLNLQARRASSPDARGGYLLRYAHEDDFGAPENAFNICTFWYIEALALSGQAAEGRRLFERMLGHRTRAGLLSEDIAFATGELWGNYPQTYSLVGLINCAHLLSRPWSAVR